MLSREIASTRLPNDLRELIDEAPHEQGDVLGPIAQRRHFDRKDVETVVQVLPERVLGDALFQVAVCRRNDPDVDAHGLRAAEPLNLPLLEHAQQLDLRVGRQVADLVEKDRRMIRQFEPPDLPRQRAGKGALLPAEQLALDERARNRRAVDADHDATAPRTLLVNLGRDEFLSGPRLAEQQHRRIGRGHLSRLFEDALDGGASSNDDTGAEAFLHLSPEVEIFSLQVVVTSS